MSRVAGSSVFLRRIFSRSGYLVSLWWGFANMSASFRRLHCLLVSAHWIESDKSRKSGIRNEEKSQGWVFGQRASGIIVMVRETLPWRRSWRAHCPWEACACTPCNPPPPCNNGCRAWTWCQTEPTHRNKDMRHIYFCHQENKDVLAANSRFLFYLCLKIVKQQDFMFTGIQCSVPLTQLIRWIDKTPKPLYES